MLLRSSKLAKRVAQDAPPNVAPMSACLSETIVAAQGGQQPALAESAEESEMTMTRKFEPGVVICICQLQRCTIEALVEVHLGSNRTVFRGGRGGSPARVPSHSVAALCVSISESNREGVMNPV